VRLDKINLRFCFINGGENKERSYFGNQSIGSSVPGVIGDKEMMAKTRLFNRGLLADYLEPEYNGVPNSGNCSNSLMRFVIFVTVFTAAAGFTSCSVIYSFIPARSSSAAGV
jgi:hypothetical protein